MFISGHYNKDTKIKVDRLNSQRLEKVTQELTALGSSDPKWDDVLQLLNSLKNDPQLKSEQAFKALVKIYTHQSIFRHIAKIMPNGEFYKIQTYLACIVQSQQLYHLKYSFKMTHKPIYRGLNPNRRFNREDYRPNSIGQWPLFQSCTTDKSVAMFYSVMN